MMELINRLILLTRILTSKWLPTPSVGAGEVAEPRKVLAEHATALTRQIAGIFGWPFDDPAVAAFVDRVRGLGIRLLLEPKRRAGYRIGLEKIAAEYDLM
jgi:hypothetical protein